MRFLLTLIILCFTPSLVQGFFIPLTTKQRVEESSVIAVIRVKEFTPKLTDGGTPFSEASILMPLFGAKKGDVIRIYEDTQEGEGSRIYSVAGRDASLESGKTYFIYLMENTRGNLVTVQSSLDCLLVTGDRVMKEDGEGSELLAEKINRTRKLIAGIKNK